MLRLALLIFVFGFVACASSRHSFEPSREQEERDKARIAEIEAAARRASYDQSLVLAREFAAKNPTSTYLQAARYWEARSLEATDKAGDAELLYRDISDKTLGVEPQWAALSQYRLAFVAESQGDDAKALARLMSAEKMAESLPTAVAQVELPARIGLLYARQGKEDEARKRLNSAEAGLRRFLSGPDAKADKTWLAQLYFQMGAAYPAAAFERDTQSFVRGRLISQGYLLKAMDLDDAVWSPQAQKSLMVTFRDTWNLILHEPSPSGVEPAVAARLRRERQVRLLTGLLQLIDDAKARRSLNESAEKPGPRDFYGFLGEIEKKANAVLYTNAEMTVLTHESLLLNSPRREGRIFGTDLLPEEKSSPKVPDPNL